MLDLQRASSWEPAIPNWAGIEDALTHSRVLANPAQLPGFWIFMYRVSPFTYLVSAVLSTGLTGTTVQCSDIELLKVSPPPGQSCADYLDPYINVSKGKLHNPRDSVDCKICSMSRTDQFLLSLNMPYSEHWRNVGLLFAYVGFNIVAAISFYWLIRVPKHAIGRGRSKAKWSR